jgi:hypothetical protein
VFSRSTLQPLFRLIGHEGSVLALLVIKEKGWLVSSSSAGDVRVSYLFLERAWADDLDLVHEEFTTPLHHSSL